MDGCNYGMHYNYTASPCSTLAFACDTLCCSQHCWVSRVGRTGNTLRIDNLHAINKLTAFKCVEILQRQTPFEHLICCVVSHLKR